MIVAFQLIKFDLHRLGCDGQTDAWSDKINKILMKKAIEMKTMMFQVEQKQKPASSPSQHPFPSSNFQKGDASTSEGKFRGSKIVRRLADSKTQRRFSFNTPKLVKSLQKSQKDRKQKQTVQQTKKVRKSKRYEHPFIPTQKMQHSYSNIKLNSIKDSQIKNDSVFRPQFQPAQTSINWVELMNSRKDRIKSEPTNNNHFKEEIMKRVEKKVQFMKKMTLDEDIQSPLVVKGQKTVQMPSKLFNFDRLYDHCLKKINKGINFYEKDIARNKDRKYYQLKIEGSILSTELKTMRRSIIQKKSSQDSHLGVIGNFIDVSKAEKAEKLNSQRQSRLTSSCKKKLGRITKNAEGRNPFTVGQLHGWQIRCQKTDQFYL